MPIVRGRKPAYKPQPISEIDRPSFKGGWNNYYKATEIKEDELVASENLMLIGAGIPTGRWGSENFYLAGSGYVRFIDSFNNINTNTNVLFSLSDLGYLTIKSGASYGIVSGASYASGMDGSATQLGNFSYIVSRSTPMAKFDGTDLSVFATLSTPSLLGASLVSGATGITTWSYKVEALSITGETTPSIPISVASLPVDLVDTTVYLRWSAVSAASGILRGYSVFRGLPGDETLIATVGPTTTSFTDQGSAQSTIYPSTSNTTGGVKAKFIKRFDDRLVIAGIENDPTLVLISGKYPNQDKFYWADGGGFVRVAPDSGDEITGIEIAGSQAQGATIRPSILVFMKNSVHQVVLNTVTIGNYLVLDPVAQQLAPTGASSFSTIKSIENNTLYFGEQGLHTIGSEAAYLNQIRTREISARIRTYIDNLSRDDFETACAGYMNQKYLLSFPLRKETVVYDYERACFMGPWKTPWGITSWHRYLDTTGNEKYLAGTDTGYVKEFSPSYLTDSGTAIGKILRSRKEDFGEWNVMKVVRTFYVLFRSVRGSVNINISLEERDGTVVTSKSFNITGSSGNTGWGTAGWGKMGYGKAQNIVSVSTDELIRWANLYKTARVMQVEVVSTGASDNWEFIGYKASAQSMGEGSLSSQYRV